MPRNFPLLFTFMLFVSPGFAQTETTRAEYERRIQALENRLVTVEAQLAVLMADRNAANGVAATPQNVAPGPAQPVSTPPVPAPQPVSSHFEMPAELIPGIGKIGAQAGLLISGAQSPFKLAPGQFYGGYIDLPLSDRPRWLHGKISYEILVGLSRSRSQVQTTSNVAEIANLAVLNAVNPSGGVNNVNDSVTGTGAAPFPVTTATKLNLRLLEVVPFGFKYTSTVFDRWRFRPYAVAGFGTYVTLHDEDPISAGVRSNANLPPAVLSALEQAFGGKSPFGTTLIAGQIGQSPELVGTGLPGGSGNLDIGMQVGGGFELRLTPSLSLGFDGRFNKISGVGGDFATYGTKIAIHF